MEPVVFGCDAPTPHSRPRSLRSAVFLRGASEASHAQSPLFALDQHGVLVANLDELA